LKAIQIHETGGPEKLKYVDIEAPEPGPKQALVKIAASGVNFIDVYQRTGLYKTNLPLTLGMEAAGVVEKLGPGVTEVRPGDRVAYAMAPDSYAEYAVVPAWQLVKIPGELDFSSAAAAMLQGMTAHYLTRSTYPLKSDETCLVHAAAGGAGRLIVQMARMAGARVITTVSTEAKAEIARKAGATDLILYTKQDFEAEVKRLTKDEGVHVVYDSVGASTFMQGLNCLRPRGMMVLFGQSGGRVPAVDPAILGAKGSLFLTRPSLAHYAASREELLRRAGEVFQWIVSGSLKVLIGHTYHLSEAAQAHRDLESRATAGKLILVTQNA